MKRNLSVILILIMMLTMLGGCYENPKESDKIHLICTTFAAYDWAKNIIGDDNSRVNLTLLPDNNVDLHSYQPLAYDIVQISTCDIIVYTGGESEKWVADALAKNKSAAIVNLLDILDENAMFEEHKEGMDESDEHEHDEEVTEYDEHVWLSLKNAALFCEKITTTLQNADPSNAAVYSENSLSYIEKLGRLDTEYQSTVEGAAKNTLLFGDRFPFAYLVKDYHLDYFAAFPGCSAETEASFETIIYLARKTDELSLDYVCTIDGSETKIAQTIIDNTTSKNQQIISLDSMQSKGKNAIIGGDTYIGIMEKNLEMLAQALGGKAFEGEAK